MLNNPLEAFDQGARVLAPRKAGLSSTAMMAYIEVAQDELMARADYIGDSLRRAHQNEDGGFDAQLRNDLKADLATRIGLKIDDILAVCTAENGANRDHFSGYLDKRCYQEGGDVQVQHHVGRVCDELERPAKEVRKKVPETNITSHGQQGGITAQNVTVHGTAQPPRLPPEPKRPWWKSVWVWVVGAVTFAAALAKVLDYFGVAPWEH